MEHMLKKHIDFHVSLDCHAIFSDFSKMMDLFNNKYYYYIYYKFLQKTFTMLEIICLPNE